MPRAVMIPHSMLIRNVYSVALFLAWLAPRGRNIDSMLTVWRQHTMKPDRQMEVHPQQVERPLSEKPHPQCTFCDRQVWAKPGLIN